MSQLSRRESTLPDRPQQSGSQSTLACPTLEPVLQDVLDSLDVNLDEELARYRRHILVQQRASRQRSSPPSAVSQSPFSFAGLEEEPSPVLLPADVEALAASVTDGNTDLDAIESGQTIQSASATSSSELMVLPSDSDAFEQGGSEGGVSSDFVSSDADQGSSIAAQRENDLTMDLPSNPDDYLESSEELLRSLEDEEKRAEAIAAESLSSQPKSSLVDSIFTPLGVGSILLLILSSATLGYLVIRPSTLNMLTSWVGGSAPSRPQQSEGGLSTLSPNLASGEFDPLNASNLSSLPGVVDQRAIEAPEGDAANAVGEMAGESVVDGNNSSNPISNAVTANAPAANRSTSNSSSPNTGANTDTGGGTAVSAPRVVGPSLSTSLPTASPRVAPPRPTPSPVPVRASTPAPSPTPVRATPRTPVRATPLPPPPAPSRPTVSVSPVDPEPIPTPIEEQIGDPSIGTTPVTSSPPKKAPVPSPPAPQATPAPAPSPSPAPAPPPVSATPVQDDLYYVTTPYTGDQSLESARGAVSGSYVRSFPEGTQVQMGAFSNPSGAETLRQNLEQQGIDAEIYTED